MSTFGPSRTEGRGADDRRVTWPRCDAHVTNRDRPQAGTGVPSWVNQGSWKRPTERFRLWRGDRGEAARRAGRPLPARGDLGRGGGELRALLGQRRGGRAG